MKFIFLFKNKNNVDLLVVNLTFYRFIQNSLIFHGFGIHDICNLQQGMLPKE